MTGAPIAEQPPRALRLVVKDEAGKSSDWDVSLIRDISIVDFQITSCHQDIDTVADVRAKTMAEER